MSSAIRGQEKLESALGSNSYTPFSKVVSLVFFEECQNSDLSYSVILELESDLQIDNFRMKMKFEGVRELQVLNFGNRPTQITGLSINDVSSRQLQDLRYEVTDYENGVIRFYCRSAEILAVEKYDPSF